MAEISRNRSGELVRGVFKILREAPEGTSKENGPDSGTRSPVLHVCAR